MQRAFDNTSVASKVFGSNEHRVIDFQPNREMGGILKLVMHITSQVGHVPAHAKRGQRTQHSTRVDLPTMIGVVEVAVRGEVVVRDH